MVLNVASIMWRVKKVMDGDAVWCREDYVMDNEGGV